MEDNQQRLFKVRDLRQKEKFVIDDEYLNGYAKIVGISGTAVYISLCRHADKNQEAFPAREKIAEQHDISIATVKRAIKTLKELSIVQVVQERKNGKWLNNIYVLLDRSQWVRPTVGHKRPTVHRGSYQTNTVGHKRPTKETHRKETHTIVENKFPQTNKEIINLLKNDKQRHIRIIGLYAEHKALENSSAVDFWGVPGETDEEIEKNARKKLNNFIKGKNALYASKIALSKDSEILKAFDYAKWEGKERDYQWKLSTVLKKLE